ncbi:unnamed protein product, partial [Schistosoma mattheei]
MVDLYTIYCSLHDCAVQLGAALEKDRIYSSWLTACNEEVYRREMSITKMNDSESSVPPTELNRPILLFSSRLVTPVQRFQRYHLLLDRLVQHETNELDRCDLQSAHKAILELCETVNIAMQLRGLSVRPSALGPFLLQGDFTISRDDVRFMPSKQRHVFLFTNAILLTKYRTSPNSFIPVLINPSTVINSAISNISRDHSIDSYEKSTNTYSAYNQSNNGLGTTSNLLAFTKSLTSSSGNSSNNLTSTNIPTFTYRPYYEIKQELELSKIGLTPHFHGDRRRFAIWTAKRAVTYIFQSSDPAIRDAWVKAINELLMVQLIRDRYKVLNNTDIQSAKILYTEQLSFNSNIPDRSKSLPNLGSNPGSRIPEFDRSHSVTTASLNSDISKENNEHDDNIEINSNEQIKNEIDDNDIDDCQHLNVKQFSIGIYSVLKDTVDKFHLAFCDLQSSQKQLQDQLIALDQALGRLAKAQDSPLNLEPFVLVLQEYKQRISKVHNSLRISQ